MPYDRAPGTLHIGSRIGRTMASNPDHAVNPHEPQHQGDERQEDRGPDIITEIAKIPHDVQQMHLAINNLVKQLAQVLAPRPFANIAPLNNTAATVLGTQGWAPALVGYSDNGGVEVEDIVIGTDAAQTVQLVAANAKVLDATIPTRVVGQVRTTATFLTQRFPTPVTLQVNENLFLLCTSASAVHLDFACRYRYARS